MKLTSICFVMRRYDEFIFSSNMMDIIHRQYGWASSLIGEGVDIFHIMGSDENKIVSTDVGSLHLIKDTNRTSVFSHSRQFYKMVAKRLDQLNPSMVIYHGLADGLSHYIQYIYTDSKWISLIQDHGNTYSRKFKMCRPLFKQFDGVLFNSLGQGEEWIKNRVFERNQIHYIPEGTSNFKINHQDRLVKLKQKNITQCLWIGNLDENKDPITIIRAIGRLKEIFDIHLNMIFRKDQLIKEVRNEIESRKLEDVITLIGTVNHEDLEQYYIDSHFILAGSAKEGSGYSVMEAMSCGVVPILTKIPSFIHFSNTGESGFLYDRKNDEALANAVSEAVDSHYERLSTDVYKFFKKELSADAIASKFKSIYEELAN